MHHLPLPLPYPAAAAGFRPPPRRRRRKTFSADFSGYNQKRSPPPDLPDPHHHSRSRAVYPLRLPQPPPPSRPSPPHLAAIPSPPRHHSHLHQHCCRHTDAPPPPSSSHPHHLHLHATLIIVTTAAPQQVKPAPKGVCGLREKTQRTRELGKKEADTKALITVDTLENWKEHESGDDEGFAPKEYGMVAGCGAACEEGAAEVYSLITGNGTDAAAGEFALMGMTSDVKETKHGVALKRFYTSAENPVKEILLKLNLPDHRKLKDGGEVKEFQRSFSHSDTERLSRNDEVFKLKNFKKYATLKLFKSTNQERYSQWWQQLVQDELDP
ncbi:hypothetical protein Tco_0351697 [Tanacetum coccineum]